MERLRKGTFSDSDFEKGDCRGSRGGSDCLKGNTTNIAMATDRETDGQKGQLVCQKHYPTLVTLLPLTALCGFVSGWQSVSSNKPRFSFSQSAVVSHWSRKIAVSFCNYCHRNMEWVMTRIFVFSEWKSWNYFRKHVVNKIPFRFNHFYNPADYKTIQQIRQEGCSQFDIIVAHIFL